MKSLVIFKTVGQTSQSVDLTLEQNAASTAAGDPILNLAFNTSGLTAYYRKGQTGTLTAITLATQTVGGAYSSGGFVKIDDTHAPGQYRFDIPDTCLLAAGGESNITFAGAPAGTAGNMEAFNLKIICTAVDLYGVPDVNVKNVGGSAADPRYVGTAQAGASNTITLAASTPAVNCVPGDLIKLQSNTGVGQSAFVASVAGMGTATPIATIYGSWLTNPGAGTVYERFATGGGLLPAQLSDVVSAILTTAMTEAYSTSGTPPTLAQFAFCLQQMLLGKFSISGTTLTVYKLDGVTTAMTFTIATSSGNPTGLTRSS